MKQLKEICLCHHAGLDFSNNRMVFQSVVWIAASFQLAARFSCTVTFAQGLCLEASSSSRELWDHLQNFLHVFLSSVFNDISFVFLEQLGIPQGCTFIKAVSTKFLIPTINPSHTHYPVPNPIVSALIPLQMWCLEALCPAFLAGWSPSASFQECNLRAPLDCEVISELGQKNKLQQHIVSSQVQISGNSLLQHY